jgi:hypothetical protein
MPGSKSHCSMHRMHTYTHIHAHTYTKIFDHTPESRGMPASKSQCRFCMPWSEHGSLSIHVCMCVCVCACVLCICMYVYTYMYPPTRSLTYTDTYTICIHAYTHTHVTCIEPCIHAYMHTWILHSAARNYAYFILFRKISTRKEHSSEPSTQIHACMCPMVDIHLVGSRTHVLRSTHVLRLEPMFWGHDDRDV